MYRGPGPGSTVEPVVEGARRFAEVGASTLVTTPVGDDPGGWLESTFGPARQGLAAVEPARR